MAQSAGTFTTQIPATGRVQDAIKRTVERTSSTAQAMPTSAANAVVFPFAEASAAMIYVSAACTITWYASYTEDISVAVAAAYDDASTPVAITQSPGAAGWYAVPAKLFAAAAIAPVASSGTPNFILMVKK